MSFAEVTSFRVPAYVARYTDESLRKVGREHNEAFVLWSGVVSGREFEVRTAHLPHQTAYRLATGTCVRVDGEELHRLNVWLYEHGEMLGVQVHTHPSVAYHSETDDAYPIATMEGAVSIVIPFFAVTGVRGPGVAAYRLERQLWAMLAPDALSSLLCFED